MGQDTTTQVSVGSSSIEPDCYVIKLDPQGTPLWARTIGGENWDSADSVEVMPDGSCMVAGVFTGQAWAQGSGEDGVMLESEGTWDAFFAVYSESVISHEHDPLILTSMTHPVG